MVKMSTFQERFSSSYDAEERRRRESGEPKLTKTMIWAAAGATSGAFAGWYSGTSVMTLDKCFRVAPILRVNPHWLFDESKKKTEGVLPSLYSKDGLTGVESNAEPAPKLLNTNLRVPVVGTAQLGDNGYGVEIEAPVGFGDGFVLYSTRDSEAYALRCRGDSMEPRIKDGEFVVVEPNYSAMPGDEVLVKTTDGRVMVKVLLYVRDEVVHLESTNKNHPNIKIPIENIDRMQYVAAICKKPMWVPD